MNGTGQYETLKYLHRDSQEFKKFIKDLEDNYESSNKQSMCLLCWGYLSSYQKKKHSAHSHYIITPSFCKNEDQFVKYAIGHKKTKENNTLIAIFNEQCQQLVENHYLVPHSMSNHRPTMPVASQAQFSQGGQGSGGVPPNTFNYNEMRNIAQKQFDQEQMLKRMQIMFQSMKDQLKMQEDTILMLRDQVEMFGSSSQMTSQAGVQFKDTKISPSQDYDQTQTQETLMKQPDLLASNQSSASNFLLTALNNQSQKSSSPFKCLQSQLIENESELVSMALATKNNSAIIAPQSPQVEDSCLPVDIIPNSAIVEPDIINKLDQYGIKVKQDIEEDFKLSDAGFTNLKSKKRQQEAKHIQKEKKKKQEEQETEESSEKNMNAKQSPIIGKRRSPRNKNSKELEIEKSNLQVGSTKKRQRR